MYMYMQSKDKGTVSLLHLNVHYSNESVEYLVHVVTAAPFFILFSACSYSYALHV